MSLWCSYLIFRKNLNPTTGTLKVESLFSLCGRNFMQFNMLMTLCVSLMMVLPALTLTRSFIILKIMTETGNKNKSYIIILMSFMRPWSDHETMSCNDDLIKIEILLKLLCSFSSIVFNVMKLTVVLFVITLFVQINEFNKWIFSDDYITRFYDSISSVETLFEHFCAHFWK